MTALGASSPTGSPRNRLKLDFTNLDVVDRKTSEASLIDDKHIVYEEEDDNAYEQFCVNATTINGRQGHALIGCPRQDVVLKKVSLTGMQSIHRHTPEPHDTTLFLNMCQIHWLIHKLFFAGQKKKLGKTKRKRLLVDTIQYNLVDLVTIGGGRSCWYSRGRESGEKYVSVFQERALGIMLSSWLKGKTRMTGKLKQVLGEVIIQVFGILWALFDQGLYHNDTSADNIMISILKPRTRKLLEYNINGRIFAWKSCCRIQLVDYAMMTQGYALDDSYRPRPESKTGEMTPPFHDICQFIGSLSATSRLVRRLLAEMKHLKCLLAARVGYAGRGESGWMTKREGAGGGGGGGSGDGGDGGDGGNGGGMDGDLVQFNEMIDEIWAWIP